MNSVATEDRPAGTIRLHCPVCKHRDVEGQIIEKRETVMQAVVIPVSTHTTWWVDCPNCKTRLYSKLPGPELQLKTADELVGVVYKRVSLVHQFFAVASVLLSWAPCLGTFVALLAIAINWKSPGWPKTASRAGLGLSVLFMVGMVVIALLFAPRQP